MNERKGKELYSLWLTKEEGKAITLALMQEGPAPIIVAILRKAYHRRDFGIR